MFSQIVTNIKVNLIFYRRNRLVFVASLFIIFMLVLSSIPGLLFMTKSKHVEIIRLVFVELSRFATILTAGLGLLFMSHHIRSRSIKMVFTKPCLPETWLLSGFLSGAIVCFSLYIIIFLLTSSLFFIWDVPFQWGIFYMTVNEFLQALIVFSYMTFLAVIFHPVAAVFFAFLFQEGVLYYGKIVLSSGIKAYNAGILTSVLQFLKVIVDIAYLVLPSFKPFSAEMSKVYSSLRLTDAEWDYLFLAFGYTFFISALFYLLSDYFLKKKRLI
ncbi:MAG: hypothetical protein HZA17_06600 [Nitrospirae bacterium]|nr:hypothetical protein [Nitrospirota bacterium]